jgi:protein kinase C substrate 80K-H
MGKEWVLLLVKNTRILIPCLLQVKMRCGTENVLTSVNEPNRCEYVFEFVTPSICHSVEGTETQGHDEL